jgi:hypothetical protein
MYDLQCLTWPSSAPSWPTLAWSKSVRLKAMDFATRRSSGALCIKSFSGMRFLSDDGAVDIIDIDDLPSWSEKATELSERLIALGGGLRDPSAPG